MKIEHESRFEIDFCPRLIFLLVEEELLVEKDLFRVSRLSNLEWFGVRTTSIPWTSFYEPWPNCGSPAPIVLNIFSNELIWS